MADEQEPPRDWHRLFGLLLTDFFTGTPFVVEIERDLSYQQQMLDVLIVRRGRGRSVSRLPDGMEGLRGHNLVTFKPHHEALNDWAMKELIGHYVAYRKMISTSPSKLIPEDQFGLYAVCARFPQKLSAKVPWQTVQPGVYDCRWGSDTVRVVVAGELPREPHNAPLHLFSARPSLVEFGSQAFGYHSKQTSLLLTELFEGFHAEGVPMPFTMEDFERQYTLNHFPRLTRKEQQEALRKLSPKDRLELLQSLTLDERLAGLSSEEVQQYFDRASGGRSTSSRTPRRKK